MIHIDKLKDKVASLPELPGVYIFKDAQGKIIYIGKAKSLKKRVQTYFARDLSTKTQVMVAKIADLEYRLTPSEAQAQILEASLVKERQPQYNISLKDDKSFPWIRIAAEEFPIVSIFRRKGRQKNDTSLYFGPYANVKLLRQALKIIRRIFGFRSCKTLPKKACLYGRLELCPAPCEGKISAGQYQEIIKDITLFLGSGQEALLEKLSLRMKEAASEHKFEEAAKIRDQINALAAVGRTRAGAPDFRGVKDLKKLLKLNKLPLRIEAFDISNIFGKEATGSMVSFYKGSADKDNYRRFRIKTVRTIDDYKMLAEVVERRYSRVIAEKLPLPDLVLIDGGRGHLLTARKELKKLGLEIPLVSIAKEQENIYSNRRAGPINLKSDTPGLNLIRRIRDEAHRFAVSYHHLLRRKKIIGK
jgi:excinuclease ABC subunit C